LRSVPARICVKRVVILDFYNFCTGEARFHLADPMAQPEIPAFGDWETTGNTPYTQKFEDARKNKKTGILAQPNDPRRDLEPPRKSPLHPTVYKTNPQDQGPRNPPHRPRPELDNQRHSDRPTHRESAPRRHSNLQREQGSNAGTPRSPYRTAAGSASPMQPNNQSKPKHRSTGMQTPERRASSEGLGQHTPGRSRMKPGGYEPEEVAVPPFGEWDDANAASGENLYVQFFIYHNLYDVDANLILSILHIILLSRKKRQYLYAIQLDLEEWIYGVSNFFATIKGLSNGTGWSSTSFFSGHMWCASLFLKRKEKEKKIKNPLQEVHEILSGIIVSGTELIVMVVNWSYILSLCLWIAAMTHLFF
ncbi:hypothetical protein ACJX0J_012397, partial [Zea mays]